MTAQGEDIVASLETAITERERMATSAAEEFGPDWDYADGHVGPLGSVGTVATGAQEFMPPEQGLHVAANDPASVLRRCAADRRMLHRHAPSFSEPAGALICGHDDRRWPCPDIADLAEGYGWTEAQR
jgi:hypothetical protein